MPGLTLSFAPTKDHLCVKRGQGNTYTRIHIAYTYAFAIMRSSSIVCPPLQLFELCQLCATATTLPTLCQKCLFNGIVNPVRSEQSDNMYGAQLCAAPCECGCCYLNVLLLYAIHIIMCRRHMVGK